MRTDMMSSRPAGLVCLLAVGFVAVTAHAAAQGLPNVVVSVQTPIVETHEVVSAGVWISGATEPYRVTIDTRAIGGDESGPLTPSNGICGGMASTYAICYTVPASVSPGPKSLDVTVVDRLDRVVKVAVTFTVAPAIDTDGDALPDGWERLYGLNHLDAAGANGSAGDPDRDGVTNRDELLAGSHPRGFVTRYLAEGATISFFATRFAVANISPQTARVLVRFLRSQGGPRSHAMTVRQFSRTTIDATDVPGLQQKEFATVVEADADIVVERTMRWDSTGYGAHAEMAASRPSTTWYLAEGATHSGLELFYLLQNPTPTDADVQVTYLLQDGRPPQVERLRVPANSRQTIWVNQVEGLAAADVSATIESTNGVPIIVERSLYVSAAGLYWGAGTDSLGIVSPSDHWFFAEGTTGEMFDLFLLIANPGTSAGVVDVDYLFDDGRVISRAYPVRPLSRQTIWVDREDDRLAAAAVSMVVTGRDGLPIIAERSMWWPGPSSAQWAEGHNAPGATRTAHAWALAEGEVRDVPATDTYVLIANTSPFAGRVAVTIMEEGYVIEQQTLGLLPSSRVTVDIRSAFPQATNRRFGIIVESLPVGTNAAAEIVVERAMYASDGRPPSFQPYWPAGTSVMGRPIGGDGQYELELSSDPGDYIGGGLPRYFVAGSGELLSLAPAPAVSPLQFWYRNGESRWFLMFGGLWGMRLVEGTYEGASRTGAWSPFQPLLDITGEGRGCGAIDGRFVVHEAVYDEAGSVVRFHVEFEQHCERGAPALRGTLRFGY